MPLACCNPEKNMLFSYKIVMFSKVRDMLQMESYIMQPPLLTLEDAARRLNTSTFSVRRWIREGKLTGIKIGQEWRIDPADLEEFIRQGRKPKK
jgi:excisionase family DNA binding protein